MKAGTPAVPPAVRRGAEVERGSFLALILGAVAIGFAPILVRLSLVGPISTAFWRIALALPALQLWLLWDRRPHAAGGAPAAPLGRSDWMLMAAAGVFFAADLGFWHWSIKLTSVANATLLANFAPVYVVLFGWVASRRCVSREFLLAMAVALAGTVLLVGGDFRLQPRALLGDFLGIVTAAFYAAYLLSIQRLRQGFATAAIMARSGLATAFVLLPVALAAREKFVPPTGRGWLVLAALALFSHVGGQSLIAYALARLPTALASVSLLVQPLTATLAASFLLGEHMALAQILGMGLVLAGVYAARLETRRT